MKYLLFFSILISSLNAIAFEIQCRESLGTVTCKEIKPSAGMQMLMDSAKAGNERMVSGLIGMKKELSAIKNRKKMEKIHDEYPDAYSVMKEGDFLDWIGTDDELINLYTKAKNSKNPSPVAFEMLLIGYKLRKMSNHQRFSEWRKTLNDSQLQNIKKSIKNYGKGNFSGIKNWLSEWDSYIIKNPVITHSKNSLLEKSETTQATSNQVIERPFKFAISESDLASLSPELKRLVPKAKDGNLRAQYALGLSFVKGEGAKENRELGISILEASAEKDHFKSQYALGTIYEKEGNYAKAARWYGRAANLGHLESQFRFGWFQWKGEERGVEKDLTKAKYWFKKAAKSGHAHAQFLLGALHYNNGQSLEAYKWIHISEENGLADKYIKSSENLKNKLAQELTESQIENSKRVALQCIKSNYKSCSY